MKKIVIGSRESSLAVAQSMTVVDAIRKALPDAQVSLLTMKTTGDRILDRTLDQIGGKGLFVGPTHWLLQPPACAAAEAALSGLGD